MEWVNQILNQLVILVIEIVFGTIDIIDVPGSCFACNGLPGRCSVESGSPNIGQPVFVMSGGKLLFEAHFDFSLQSTFVPGELLWLSVSVTVLYVDIFWFQKSTNNMVI